MNKCGSEVEKQSGSVVEDRKCGWRKAWEKKVGGT